MKKLFLLAAAAVISMSMVSCKKDYTCTCTIAGSTSTSTIPNSTKKDAQTACDALNASASILGGSCVLN